MGEVTTATFATTPKTQLQPPFGPSVDSLCHPWFTTTNLSYRFPIFETSATALCGTSTTGIAFIHIYILYHSYPISHQCGIRRHKPSQFHQPWHRAIWRPITWEYTELLSIPNFIDPRWGSLCIISFTMFYFSHLFSLKNPTSLSRNCCRNGRTGLWSQILLLYPMKWNPSWAPVCRWWISNLRGDYRNLVYYITTRRGPTQLCLLV